jgi:hypothetical protein
MFPSSARANHTARETRSRIPLIARPSNAMNCGMVREDPVSKAFRRVLEAAGREAATPPTGERPMDLVSVALGMLALVLVGLGVFALCEGWLVPRG